MLGEASWTHGLSLISYGGEVSGARMPRCCPGQPCGRREPRSPPPDREGFTGLCARHRLRHGTPSFIVCIKKEHFILFTIFFK